MNAILHLEYNLESNSISFHLKNAILFSCKENEH